MKDEDKKKVEPIKDLKTLRKKREKSALTDITERKRAEKELKDSEEYLKILFDYAPDAYYINDLKGNFIDGNKAAERVIGYKKEELIGKNFLKLKLLSLADIPKAAKLLAKNLRRLPTGPDEFILNRKDNSKVTVEISTYPVKIKGKTLVLGIARDVTERKQAEKKLSETKEYLENLIKYANVPIIVWDTSLSITRFNRAFENLSGYHASEVIGKKIDILFSKNKIESALEHIQKTSSGERWKTVEIEIQRKDGEPRIVLWNLANILDTEKKNVIATIAQGQDITERKQAEEKIKHLNLVLRAIRRVNQLIVREKDREKLLKGACENLIKTRGYHNTWIALLDEEGKLKTYAEAGLGKAFLPMIELLKRGKLTTCSQKALKQQEMLITEDPASTCTECPLAQKYSGRAGFTIRLEYNGKVYGLMSVSIPAHLAVDQEEQSLFEELAEDIAFCLYNIELDEERKQSTEALRTSEERYFNLFDNANDLIQVVNPAGKMLAVNKKWLATLEYSQEDVKGLRVTDIIRKDKIPQISEKLQEATRGRSVGFETVFISKSGKEINVEGRGNGIFKDGKLVSAVGIFRDITERKQAEVRLKKCLEASINTMSKIVEVKDPYTSGHQHRVSQLATAIAKELNFSKDKIEGIRIASLIHDIGKIGLPTEILSKPTKLFDIEFSLIKSHSQIGHDILKSIDFPYPIERIVLQHHERLDGSGYPNNLKGDKIMLEARIIGVADVVEAMSSHRPYRPALGIDAALEEIIQNRGTLYDPEVVDVCLKLFKEKGFKFE